MYVWGVPGTGFATGHFRRVRVCLFFNFSKKVLERKFCDANYFGLLVENPSLKLPSSRNRRGRRSRRRISITKSQSRPFCAGANHQAQTIYKTGGPLGMRVSVWPRDLAPFGPVALAKWPKIANFTAFAFLAKTLPLALPEIMTESTRTLTNFDFRWTKILYQNNLKHIAFFLTFFWG